MVHKHVHGEECEHDDDYEEVQNKLEDLLIALDKLEDEEERVMGALNVIIGVAQNASENMFEFLGMLEEAKFLYREDIVKFAEEELMDGENEEGVGNPFTSNN